LLDAKISRIIAAASSSLLWPIAGLQMQTLSAGSKTIRCLATFPLLGKRLSKSSPSKHCCRSQAPCFGQKPLCGNQSHLLIQIKVRCKGEHWQSTAKITLTKRCQGTANTDAI